MPPFAPRTGALAIRAYLPRTMNRTHRVLRSLFLVQALATPLVLLALKAALQGTGHVAPFRVLIALVFEVPLLGLLAREVYRVVKPLSEAASSAGELALTAGRGLAASLILGVAAVLTVDETVVELICGYRFGDGLDVMPLVVWTFVTLGLAALLVAVGSAVGYADAARRQ
jgi:hypothetical protein